MILVNNFYIAPDEEIIFTGPVDLRVVGELVIDGVLRGAEPQSRDEGSPRMKLSSMTGIVIRGELHAFPGYDAQVGGEDGGDGGDLELRAPILVSDVEVTGGRGGNGAIGGGDGGNGGSLIYYGSAIARTDSPRIEITHERLREIGRRPSARTATCWLRGGDGGEAGRGDSRIGSRNGGNGGSGGSGTGRSFEEEPWMVYYRSRLHMDNEQAAEALKRFNEEFASGIVQTRFEPVPVEEPAAD
ncbi:MAG: hypothetical protein NXI14_06895 [bacterium]|nr:hypothetical protein [bacterium]